jgi:plasmid maintenance system antidote protein VapI
VPSTTAQGVKMWAFINNVINDEELNMEAEIALKLRKVIDAKMEVLMEAADNMTQSKKGKQS